MIRLVEAIIQFIPDLIGDASQLIEDRYGKLAGWLAFVTLLPALPALVFFVAVLLLPGIGR